MVWLSFFLLLSPPSSSSFCPSAYLSFVRCVYARAWSIINWFCDCIRNCIWSMRCVCARRCSWKIYFSFLSPTFHFVIALHAHNSCSSICGCVCSSLLPFFLINMKRINAAVSKRNNVKLQMHLWWYLTNLCNARNRRWSENFYGRTFKDFGIKLLTLFFVIMKSIKLIPFPKYFMSLFHRIMDF